MIDSTTPLPVIGLDEYVGTSLFTINNNFNILKEQQTLTYNNALLLQQNIQTLNSALTGLSALTPRFAKAWINFNGIPATPTILSRSLSAHKIDVTKTSTGTYSLSFTPPFSNTNYALIGTCQEQITGTEYTWVQPTQFNSLSAQVVVRGLSGTTLVDCPYISIAIFNN